MSIILNHVDYVYGAGTVFEQQALKDINLKIEDGEFLGIIGHTGSGKSTLIQLFNGLLQPTSGGVYYNGADINDAYDKRKLRTKVGLVFQYPEHQLFESTIFKDVCFGPLNQGLSEKEAGLRAFEALRMSGVEESLYYQPPFDLSGGQKKRVAIAGVLAMKPEVLVLDEPTAGLDPVGRKELLDMIKTLHEKQNMTVVLVSHSMEDVAEYVDRLIVVSQGSIALDGTVKEVFSQTGYLEELGLAVPQVTYLMRDLRQKGLPVALDATTLEEAKNEILKCFGGKQAWEKTLH